MPRSKKSQVETIITGPQLASDDPEVEQHEEAPNPAILAATYTFADAPLVARLNQIIARYHQPFIDAKLNIDLQFWLNSDGAPSVKVAGMEKFGKVKVFRPDQRAAGSPDMRLIVDLAKWDNATLDEQAAALDHLLQSKEVVTTDKGEVLRDKAGRPKLKKRKADLVVEGYTRIVEEHGMASIEGKQFAIASKPFEQLKLFDTISAMSAEG